MSITIDDIYTWESRESKSLLMFYKLVVYYLFHWAGMIQQKQEKETSLSGSVQNIMSFIRPIQIYKLKVRWRFLVLKLALELS